MELGDFYYDVLTKFVMNNDATLIENCCLQVPSFAGFWFEHMCFDHHKTDSKIDIDYMNRNDKISKIVLSIHKVIKLDTNRDF